MLAEECSYKRAKPGPSSRYVDALREMPGADYLLKLLIDDELRKELSSKDLIEFTDKVSGRLSSVHAPEA